MNERTDTQPSFRVSFQGDADANVHRFIVEQAEALQRLYGAFAYCHVIVEAPDVRDGRYGASLFLTMPGDVEICVDCHGPLDDRFCDPKFTVSEVFRRARRLIAGRSSRRHGRHQIMHDEITGETGRLERRQP